jgi:hypothetical protein
VDCDHEALLNQYREVLGQLRLVGGNMARPITEPEGN